MGTTMKHVLRTPPVPFWSRLHTEGSVALGSYQHPYRWIAQAVLGSARKESHVRYLLTNNLHALDTSEQSRAGGAGGGASGDCVA
jgi:hypothetical protein